MSSGDKSKYDQVEYNRKWQEKNKKHVTYLKTKSSAKSFIKNKATAEDLEEFKELIKERENFLKEGMKNES